MKDTPQCCMSDVREDSAGSDKELPHRGGAAVPFHVWRNASIITTSCMVTKRYMLTRRRCLHRFTICDAPVDMAVFINIKTIFRTASLLNHVVKNVDQRR